MTPTRQSGASPPSVAEQLRRRRAASRRCPPLADGRRDPLDTCTEPIAPGEIDSWRAAWLHLTCRGLPPLVPYRVTRAARTQRSHGGDGP